MLSTPLHHPIHAHTLHSYVCIHQWGATRRVPTCPVCRGQMSVVVLSDGREQVRPGWAGLGWQQMRVKPVAANPLHLPHLAQYLP